MKTKIGCRLLVIVLAALLTLMISACGGGSTATGSNIGNASSAQNPSSQPNTSQQAPAASVESSKPANENSGSLFDWMKSKSFSYDYTQFSDSDPDSAVKGTLMVDGENVCSIQYLTVDGKDQIMKTLIKDGTTYMIIEDQKAYFSMGALGSNMMEGSAFDTEGLARLGEGEDTLDGKMMHYEAYEQEMFGVKSTLKVFSEGNQVRGFVTEGTLELPGSTPSTYRTTMLIHNAKNSVDKSAFEIPSDYTELKEPSIPN